MLLVQHNTLRAIWFVFAVLWFLPAIFAKRTIQRQAPGSRILQIFLVLTAYVLIFNPVVRGVVLNLRVVPASTRPPSPDTD